MPTRVPNNDGTRDLRKEAEKATLTSIVGAVGAKVTISFRPPSKRSRLLLDGVLCHIKIFFVICRNHC